MKNIHGILYAYHDFDELRELGAKRTGAALPFCGRYRLIDFSLSAMMNAGIHNVGVIMQRDYQSLLDHLSGGKAWDLARNSGGLNLLPPFGVPGFHTGVYEGCMQALNSVHTYVSEIEEEYVVLMRGDLLANIDLRAAAARHFESGADVTAVCIEGGLPGIHQRFVDDGSGFAKELVCMQVDSGRGVASLEVYIMKKQLLLELVDWCAEGQRIHFHRHALTHLMGEGGRVALYMHKGYARLIASVDDYFSANMDMLKPELRDELFGSERSITTHGRSDASTYYSDKAVVVNSLVADGCVIEGKVENCILFDGVKVREDASLKNCIVMGHTEIGEGAQLNYVIADKRVNISPNVTLTGNEKLPIVIPKNGTI